MDSIFKINQILKSMNLPILIKFVWRTELSLGPGCITDHDLNTYFCVKCPHGCHDIDSELTLWEPCRTPTHSKSIVFEAFLPTAHSCSLFHLIPSTA